MTYSNGVDSAGAMITPKSPLEDLGKHRNVTAHLIDHLFGFAVAFKCK